MARDISHLEPAERDPVQLRRTGITIAIIMILGGIVVTWAYKGVHDRQANSGRPPIVAKLKDNFGAVNQDQKAFAMSQLEGKRTLLALIALNEPETTKETLSAMKRVAVKLKDEEDLRFVGITIDPQRDTLELLKEFAAAEGLAEDPRWVFVAAGEKETRGYVKDQLRLGQVTEEEIDGAKHLKFVSLIALIDSRLHLRGRYDFRQALDVQEDAKRMLKEEPEKAKKYKASERTEEVKALEEHILHALAYISTEELKAK